MLLHPFIFQRECQGVVLGDVSHGVHSSPDPSPDLNHELDLVFQSECLVELGPISIEDALRMSHALPAFFCHVWGKRCQHDQQGIQGLGIYGCTPTIALGPAPHGVEVFHEARYRRVVAEAIDVVCDLLDRLVQLALYDRVQGAGGAVRRAGFVNGAPDLVEEPADAGDALIPEIPTLLVRAEEHEIHPERVGAPPLDVGVGSDYVAARLRHLGTVAYYGAVCAEPSIGLLERKPPQVVQGHRNEPRVHQVEHGVLVAADVLRYRKPALR